ncbi:twin transmembrane helix small protein [Oricola cellulosilytica]|uniref:Twin transmembrane helix small protein n=1 Tax=Oricola cellulosilytica TaxID=1429082 RepID=A0A4R0PBG0_9HYPH|nr:twin transmembrane helix small protein [Oricola cellulosilytica]TCD13687.1 twin transmembrane helix small protein [Oricola cellulosilytica]
MSDVLFYLALAVMLAVAATLMVGLRNMMRSGDGNFSNKMMQLRVFLQFVAVVVIVIGIWIARSGGAG